MVARVPASVGPRRADLSGAAASRRPEVGRRGSVASYTVDERAVVRPRELIDGRQYVLRSRWGDVQPGADAENAYLERH
jgi:hypothetical protein